MNVSRISDAVGKMGNPKFLRKLQKQRGLIEEDELLELGEMSGDGTDDNDNGDGTDDNDNGEDALIPEVLSEKAKHSTKNSSPPHSPLVVGEVPRTPESISI